MRPKKKWFLLMACAVQLALLTATTGDALAFSGSRGGYAHFRGRAYTQFSLGPAITFYTMHRELVDPVPGVDNTKKWWRFLGGARNYDLSMAYVFANGFILGGDVSLLRSHGISSLQDISRPAAPENPGEVYSVMMSPVLGVYPRPYLGLSLLVQPLIGYSTFAARRPTGGLRVSAGYEWPAGPSGAMGLSLAMEMMFSKTEEDGSRPSIKYDVVHLPVSAMLNICFKGFWDRREKTQPDTVETQKNNLKK